MQKYILTKDYIREITCIVLTNLDEKSIKELYSWWYYYSQVYGNNISFIDFAMARYESEILIHDITNSEIPEIA